MAMNIVNELLCSENKPVFLCVGSDKVLGDCVGAYTGELLSKKYHINAFVYGNLDNSVNANNLEKTIQKRVLLLVLLLSTQ